jgi:hypothetical protein
MRGIQCLQSIWQLAYYYAKADIDSDDELSLPLFAIRLSNLISQCLSISEHLSLRS